MASRFLQRITRVAVLLAGASLVAASVVDARPVRRTARPAAARGFNLFAGAVNVTMNVNRVQCNINNIGESCVDGTNSPSLPGGFWPRGTGNQYIFNAGLQIAGLIGGTDTPTFPWPGDTVGAFFFDPRGDQAHGEGRTNVFNALNAADLAEWPTAAGINDTSLFHPALVGRQTVSQQDTWVRFWDGNTNLTTGRQHPMGLLVEQRGLAWNFPSGNQDIVYFLYRFINITSVQAADYAGLADVGYNAADIAEIVTIAQEFQSRSEAAYNVDIPAGGYPFTDLFAAFAQDPDVTGNAGNNYSSGNLVFGLGFAYSGSWTAEASFVYPPDINGAPFANAPGFEAVKYLKSPQDIGIAMFGNTTNGGAFPDSRGVQQLWRRLSANLQPADGTCNSGGNPAARRFCFVNQAISDTRFFQSSGPFTLNPGESSVIVVAYVHAAPLATAPAATPGQGMPAIPAFTLPIGTNTPPGFPLEGVRLRDGVDVVQTVDRAMGWLNHSDVDGDGEIEQNEVTTAPRSLLNKALVAQAVFDNKFLLPFAPEAPQFFLVPGDNQVTIAWQRSATETLGDPYFGIASAPLDNLGNPNALFDPNFREFDVEGYRIWRGRTQATMEVIAAFDYAGTTVTDFTGQFFVAADYGNSCAPELGVLTSCPAPFLTASAIRAGREANPAFTSPTHDVVLAGDIIQIPPGGRVQLASGVILNTGPDTAITGGNSGLPSLIDNGVPFAFIDNTVRNGFRYFYAVTAFDINSVASGPSSLESPLVTKTVSPRVGTPNEVQAALSFGIFGDGDSAIVTDTPFSIDPATGRFSGTPSGTAAAQVAAAFAPLVPQLLPGLSLTFQIDSMRVRHSIEGVCADTHNWQGICYDIFATFTQGTVATSVSSEIFVPIWTAGGDPSAVTSSLGQFAVIADSLAASRFGIPNGFAQFNASVEGTFRQTIFISQLENAHGRRILGSTNSPGGSRWFSGANETMDHPTVGAQVGQLPAPVDSIAYFAGHIDLTPGVAGTGRPSGAAANADGVGESTAMQCHNYSVAGFGRQADINVTWGAGGQIASVRDKTHHLAVPFFAVPGPSYGFVGDYNGNGVIDWRDFDQLVGVATVNQGLTFCSPSTPTGLLAAQPTIGPVSLAYNGTAGTSATFPNNGQGFGLYINGQFFIIRLAGGAAPADGTVWTLRTYAGAVTATTNNTSATPSGYTYAAQAGNPALPGLRVVYSVPARTESRALSQADLDAVHTVPDPYYVTNALEITANTKVLRFVNLPDRAIIRIYSASGVLVNIVNHNNVGLGGEATWNLRNRNNQFVASGVYFYHVETPEGLEKVGRFTVVNFAQ